MSQPKKRRKLGPNMKEEALAQSVNEEVVTDQAVAADRAANADQAAPLVGQAVTVD